MARALVVILAILLTATGANAQSVSARTLSPRNCLDVSVDTSNSAQLRSAIAICTLVLDQHNTNPTQRAAVLAHRGVAYRNTSNLEKSAGDLRAARDLTPDDPLTSRMLAWTLREMNRLDDAEREFSRSLKLEAHPQAFLSRCYVRFDLKKYADALTDCETAHGVDPTEDSAYFTARLYRLLDRTSSAVPLLEPLIGTPMESSRVYRLLADLYTAMDRHEDARRLHNQSRRRFPKEHSLNEPQTPATNASRR